MLMMGFALLYSTNQHPQELVRRYQLSVAADPCAGSGGGGNVAAAADCQLRVVKLLG